MTSIPRLPNTLALAHGKCYSGALAWYRLLMAKPKNPAAVTLGRKGGRKRAEKRGWEKIPAKRRSELARKAVLARWAKARNKISCE